MYVGRGDTNTQPPKEMKMVKQETVGQMKRTSLALSRRREAWLFVDVADGNIGRALNVPMDEDERNDLLQAREYIRRAKGTLMRAGDDLQMEQDDQMESLKSDVE